MKKGDSRHISAFDIVNVCFFLLISVCFIYPIWYCVVSALTSADEISKGIPLLWPRDITFQAFEFIFNDADILGYYKNTIIYAVAGTAISLMLTALMAYPFVIDDFKGKRILNVFMVIPMFFGGGLLPTYYLITGLGLKNTIWVMLLPGAVSAYNTIIFRTFFKSIPASLREAAYIDGADHYRVLFTIMIPLSKALLATFGLFGLVGKWNDWFTPFLYLSSDEMKPISLYLRSVLVSSENTSYDQSAMYQIYQRVQAQNVKCASVLITIVPILCVYPFLQKYFAKGVMVGAIKS